MDGSYVAIGLMAAVGLIGALGTLLYTIATCRAYQAHVRQYHERMATPDNPDVAQFAGQLASIAKRIRMEHARDSESWVTDTDATALEAIQQFLEDEEESG